MSRIELVGARKKFEREEVLRSLDLTVENGELVSLLGPSGCGKTTTLKLISGLLSLDGGDIKFDGESVLDVAAEKRGAVIVFQDHLLFPHMTVEKNVDFGLKMMKKDRAYRARKVDETLKLVRLDGFRKKYPSELSGGQKQRVAIARALAVEPKVLLLDEPFSNLDTGLKETMRALISELQKELKITTVLVTHDKEDAMTMSDRIAIMMGGELLQFGTPVELYERPNSPEVASFFGDASYIEGNSSDGIVATAFGEFKLDCVDGHANLMVRPEDVKISQAKVGAASGTIASRRYAGDRIHYTVRSGGIELKCTAEKTEVFELGEEVSVELKRERIVCMSGESR